VIARGLSASAGRFALHDVSFELSAGSWGIVLGPTGAGKTTLLETIAGVRRATNGQVILRDVDVTRQPPEQRRVGIVYQHGYLFPHLTVDQNIGYGASDGVHARRIAIRLGADALSGRPVSSLSGGERQIVALARALAPRPDILLLDEPFAALDPRRRAQVRRELRAVQREAGITVLHVTHDFAEAGTLGDMAMVLEAGRLTQAGPVATLFHQPASGEVAAFLGAENVFAGTIERMASGVETDEELLRFVGEGLSLVGVGSHPGGAGHAVVRGSEVVLARKRSAPTSARNVLQGSVEEVVAEGVLARVHVRVGATTLVAVLTRDSVQDLELATGVDVVASIKATAVHLC
jgi:molybdopterin-binding protein